MKRLDKAWDSAGFHHCYMMYFLRCFHNDSDLPFWWLWNWFYSLNPSSFFLWCIRRLHWVPISSCLPLWDGSAWQGGYGSVTPSLSSSSHPINPVDHSHSVPFNEHPSGTLDQVSQPRWVLQTSVNPVTSSITKLDFLCTLHLKHQQITLKRIGSSRPILYMILKLKSVLRHSPILL